MCLDTGIGKHVEDDSLFGCVVGKIRRYSVGLLWLVGYNKVELFM